MIRLNTSVPDPSWRPITELRIRAAARSNGSSVSPSAGGTFGCASCVADSATPGVPPRSSQVGCFGMYWARSIRLTSKRTRRPCEQPFGIKGAVSRWVRVGECRDTCRCSRRVWRRGKAMCESASPLPGDVRLRVGQGCGRFGMARRRFSDAASKRYGYFWPTRCGRALRRCSGRRMPSKICKALDGGTYGARPSKTQPWFSIRLFRKTKSPAGDPAGRRKPRWIFFLMSSPRRQE
jgi:hypothetical protein